MFGNLCGGLVDNVYVSGTILTEKTKNYNKDKGTFQTTGGAGGIYNYDSYGTGEYNCVLADVYFNAQADHIHGVFGDHGGGANKSKLKNSFAVSNGKLIRSGTANIPSGFNAAMYKNVDALYNAVSSAGLSAMNFNDYWSIKADGIYFGNTCVMSPIGAEYLPVTKTILLGGNVTEIGGQPAVNSSPITSFDFTKVVESGDASKITAIRDITNNLDIGFSASGNTVTITNYDTVYGSRYGRFKWLITAGSDKYIVDAVNASHIINTKADLQYDSNLGKQYQAVSNTGLSVTNPTSNWYIALAADIDMEGAYINKSGSGDAMQGFGAQHPDGDADSDKYCYFRGTFDGMGHSISNARTSIGFICNTGAGSKVCNLAYLNAYGCSQGIMGNNGKCLVENCIVTVRETLSKATSAFSGFWNYGEGGGYRNCILMMEATGDKVAAFRAHMAKSNGADNPSGSDVAAAANSFVISSTVTKADIVSSATEVQFFTGVAAFKTALGTTAGQTAMSFYNEYWSVKADGVYFGSTQVITFPAAE